MTLDTSEPIPIKIKTSMLTEDGFTSLRLGEQTMQKPGKQTTSEKSYVGVGVSGGGWRALAGHMGAFRELGNQGALAIVHRAMSRRQQWTAPTWTFTEEISATSSSWRTLPTSLQRFATVHQETATCQSCTVFRQGARSIRS